MKSYSNTYMFLYVSALVVIIAVVLSLVSLGLRPRREANVQAEKALQILKASGYAHVERAQAIVAFDSLAEKESSRSDGEMYRIRCADGSTGHVIPLQGKGLWGAIWGYAVLSDDLTTIKGVSFAHKSETPGLGAKITEEAFECSFEGKKLYDADGHFVSVKVVPKGKGEAIAEKNRVDAISGATITSRGVDKMLADGFQRIKE
jgi:Na+-transporting NADH:ubiquinone oxidoreductase subunit C